MSNEYDFGYGGNAYFNGRDGTITRVSDGATVRFNVKDGMLAVSVKDYSFGLRDSAPEDVKAMAAELPRRVSEWGELVPADQAMYESHARPHFWNDAEWLVTEDPEAPEWATDTWAAGRSGGWCCIDGTQHYAEQGFPMGTPDTPEDPGEAKELADALRFREEFARLAFAIHACIDGAHEALEEIIREEYAELESRRTRNTVKSVN